MMFILCYYSNNTIVGFEMASFFQPFIEKEYIKLKLKPYSQLKREYGLGDHIYRAAKPERFSKKSIRSFEKGIPNARHDSYVPLWSEESEVDAGEQKPGETIIPQIVLENTTVRANINEPLWYACDEASAKKYCKDECMVYKYTPLDQTDIKGIQLLYLDLTSKIYYTERGLYELDKTLMKIAYDYLYTKYAENMMYDTDSKQKYLCVDYPCDNTFSLDEISSAYGNYGNIGFRNSEYFIDRFFTLTLFEMLDKMGIVDKNTHIVGYFHADLINGDIDSDGKSIISPNSVFSAEFAIKYGTAINKTRIQPNGLVSARLGGTANSKKDKRTHKHKKTHKRKHKKVSSRKPNRNTIHKHK